jgi:hypothetical protein
MVLKAASTNRVWGNFWSTSPLGVYSTRMGFTDAYRWANKLSRMFNCYGCSLIRCRVSPEYTYDLWGHNRGQTGYFRLRVFYRSE